METLYIAETFPEEQLGRTKVWFSFRLPSALCRFSSLFAHLTNAKAPWKCFDQNWRSFEKNSFLRTCSRMFEFQTISFPIWQTFFIEFHSLWNGLREPRTAIVRGLSTRITAMLIFLFSLTLMLIHNSCSNIKWILRSFLRNQLSELWISRFENFYFVAFSVFSYMQRKTDFQTIFKLRQSNFQTNSKTILN